MGSGKVSSSGLPIAARAGVQAVVPGCKLRADGTQNVPNSVWTKLTSWTAVAFDPLGMQTPANPSRLTIKYPGRYAFFVDFRWSIAVATGCAFAIYKNGVVPTGPAADTNFSQATSAEAGVTANAQQISGFDDCAAGDYYEVFAFVSGAATLRTDASFSAYYIGPGLLATGPSGVPPGTELDYKQIIADVSGISATTEAAATTVIAGNSVAYDGTKVRIEFWLEGDQQSGADTISTFVLLRDTTVLGQISASVQASIRFPVSGIFYDTPSAGSHTYSLKAFVAGASLTVKAGPGGSGQLLPSFLRVTKA